MYPRVSRLKSASKAPSCAACPWSVARKFHCLTHRKTSKVYERLKSVTYSMDCLDNLFISYSASIYELSPNVVLLAPFRNRRRILTPILIKGSRSLVSSPCFSLRALMLSACFWTLTRCSRRWRSKSPLSPSMVFDSREFSAVEASIMADWGPPDGSDYSSFSDWLMHPRPRGPYFSVISSARFARMTFRRIDATASSCFLRRMLSIYSRMKETTVGKTYITVLK